MSFSVWFRNSFNPAELEHIKEIVFSFKGDERRMNYFKILSLYLWCFFLIRDFCLCKCEYLNAGINQYIYIFLYMKK